MALLEIKDLHVDFKTEQGLVHAIRGVSLAVEKGDVLGIVGESGSGKSVTMMSVLGLNPSTANITADTLSFNGTNLLKASKGTMRKLRGGSIGMIFQDPMTSLNPLMTVGDQITEALKIHRKMNAAGAKSRAIELLSLVDIPAPESRLKQYPHQLSGGLRQRIMIAIAIACEPQLLIADEPTTALDVTIQAEVLDLIKESIERFDTAMILITHDLGVVAETSDDVAVVYAGRIIEMGPKEAIFEHATHPYTNGLFGSLPEMNSGAKRLNPIPGSMPDPTDLPDGCAFAPRCPLAKEECTKGDIPFNELAPGHFCRCIFKTQEDK